jgi:hypothetical protein
VRQSKGKGTGKGKGQNDKDRKTNTNTQRQTLKIKRLQSKDSNQKTSVNFFFSKVFLKFTTSPPFCCQNFYLFSGARQKKDSFC